MDHAAAQSICELFGLGAPLVPAVSVGGGLTHRMWRISTDHGAFAVKELNRDFENGDYTAWYERAFKLEQAALLAGVPMPRPVAVARTGGCLAELPGTGARPTTVRVHAWVDGETLNNGTVYPMEVSGRIAAMMARIHGLGIVGEVEAGEALKIYGDEHWRGRVEDAERSGAAWATQLRAVLPALGELEAYLAKAHDDAAPFLLSHRDSDMKNTMRTLNGELLLVDWDAAGPVNARHDLANHALVWAGVHLGEPRPALARAFVDAYRRAGGIDEPFRHTDLAEMVSARLAWFEFNVRRALGERSRDDEDRRAGAAVIARNVTQLPRFASSLTAWLAVLGD